MGRAGGVIFALKMQRHLKRDFGVVCALILMHVAVASIVFDYVIHTPSSWHQ